MTLRSTALLAATVALAGCALTRPVRQVPESGFLSNYSQLHKGAEGQAEMVYIRPGVDWKQYNRMLLDPVTIWRTLSNSGVSQHDAQLIADYFYRTMYDTFSRSFLMVRTPQPNTLRVAVALTQLGHEDVVLDVISTIEPHVRVVTSLYQLATGKPTFEGDAAVEARITDATTGELLAEGVDKRIGERTLNSRSLKSWGDVENIIQFWVARSAYNLCRAQERPDCQPPPKSGSALR